MISHYVFGVLHALHIPQSFHFSLLINWIQGQYQPCLESNILSQNVYKWVYHSADCFTYCLHPFSHHVNIMCTIMTFKVVILLLWFHFYHNIKVLQMLKLHYQWKSKLVLCNPTEHNGPWHAPICTACVTFPKIMGVAWCSGKMQDSHAGGRGSIPGLGSVC